MPNTPHFNQNGEIALESIGDVYREQARLYRMAEKGTLDVKVAKDLADLLKNMWQIKQDQRDNKYKQQLAALWKEYQARLANKSNTGRVLEASIVDVTAVSTGPQPPVSPNAPIGANNGGQAVQESVSNPSLEPISAPTGELIGANSEPKSGK